MAEVLLETLAGLFRGPQERLSAAAQAESPDRAWRQLAATDQVNDFEGVTRLNQGLLPSPAREDVAISLDGNPIRGEAQVSQESLDV